MLVGLKIVKLLGLIAGMVCLNIIVFSPGLLGVNIGRESAIETASGVTLLVMSFLGLLYGSYVLLFKSPAALPVKDIKTVEDYRIVLNHYKPVKVLRKDISHAIDQIDRLGKKKDTLLHILNQRFEQTELSYKKFVSVIIEVEKLFFSNMRGILNKLSVFEAADLAAFTNQQAATVSTNKWVKERSELYHGYIAYIVGYLGANEEILLKLDQLLLEISKLGSTDYRDVEDMPCMQEIDALIKQTKFYKQ